MFIFTVFYHYFWDILRLFDERNTSYFLNNTKIYRINYWRYVSHKRKIFIFSEYYSQIFTLLSSPGASFIKSYGLYPVSISYKIQPFLY